MVCREAEWCVGTVLKTWAAELACSYGIGSSTDWPGDLGQTTQAALCLSFLRSQANQAFLFLGATLSKCFQAYICKRGQFNENAENNKIKTLSSYLLMLLKASSVQPLGDP